ncbi:FkbM family methyltransferase [Salinarimonas rosea]|uniref:FkbM family methyltransferase n=1 Tax=Salinarimonas rosea TaxID=552063 RepID=UPI0004059BE2|nr:FkbM family methyltransferase [Salinarimonas rosea]
MSPRAEAIGRSLRLYHGDPARAAALDALYRPFVPHGGLAFDIGAHVGDRTAAFRRLGARAVALEPQPACFRALRLIHGRDHRVTLVAAACGDASGEVRLSVNSANPTVSTASSRFVEAAAGAPGWEGQAWDEEIVVPCLTLDALIATHGRPDFVKIDVEGFEDRVLAGLSTAVPALSFEFTTIARGVAHRCLARLAGLGNYRFALSLGESATLEAPGWIEAAAMAARLDALPHAANSGDVYAALTPPA